MLSFPAHALLLGENAAKAPLNKLKIAHRLYQKGRSHDHVWKKTGWYCPQGAGGKCRWEISGTCTNMHKINTAALKHSIFRGNLKIGKVFNARCIYQQYPTMKDSIEIYHGKCDGWGGFARPSHNDEKGKICISTKLLEAIKGVSKNSLIKNKDRILEAKKQLHRVFIHEMQHHIQFIEKWEPYPYNIKCPYQNRAWEVEAFYVDGREYWSRNQKRSTAPHWWRSGLC